MSDNDYLLFKGLLQKYGLRGILREFHRVLQAYSQQQPRYVRARLALNDVWTALKGLP